MDLQKEREAFEATQNPIVFERIVYIEKANLFTMKDDFRDDLFTVNKCNELNFGWSSWQAAKNHEAEKLEGCVVVPVEPTYKQLDVIKNSCVAIQKADLSDLEAHRLYRDAIGVINE